MKKVVSLVTSIAAMSSVALPPVPAADQEVDIPCYHHSHSHRSNKGHQAEETVRKESTLTAVSTEKEKYAPRFDGLRFIETLVTAHR